jgi:hypothetical protein
MAEEKPIETTFHLFDINFYPYKDGVSLLDSERILKETVKHIQDNLLQGQKAIVIDRNKGRKEPNPRNLVITSAAYSHPDKKYKCKIRLLRENNLPEFLNKTDYTMVSLADLDHLLLAETTNFYIDLSRGYPIVCCEFNHHGPRIADIEYFLRYVSFRTLKISKKCQVSIHMKLPINEVLGSLENVLKFDMKVKPNVLKYLYESSSDSFFTNMTGLSGTVDPSFLRVEAFFRQTGETEKYKKNTKAVSVMKKILKLVSDNENAVENFEDFNLEYTDSAGNEHVFNLISGKEEIVVTSTIGKSKELYNEAIKLFDKYLVEKYKD